MLNAEIQLVQTQLIIRSTCITLSVTATDNTTNCCMRVRFTVIVTSFLYKSNKNLLASVDSGFIGVSISSVTLPNRHDLYNTACILFRV